MLVANDMLNGLEKSERGVGQRSSENWQTVEKGQFWSPVNPDKRPELCEEHVRFIRSWCGFLFGIFHGAFDLWYGITSPLRQWRLP